MDKLISAPAQIVNIPPPPSPWWPKTRNWELFLDVSHPLSPLSLPPFLRITKIIILFYPEIEQILWHRGRERGEGREGTGGGPRRSGHILHAWRTRGRVQAGLLAIKTADYTCLVLPCSSAPGTPLPRGFKCLAGKIDLMHSAIRRAWVSPTTNSFFLSMKDWSRLFWGL